MRALRCCAHLQLPNSWFTVLSQVSDRALDDGDGVAAQLAAHVAADILILLCDAEAVVEPPGSHASHSIDVFHPNTAFATGARPPAFLPVSLHASQLLQAPKAKVGGAAWKLRRA
jgi:hypothetical protein